MCRRGSGRYAFTVPVRERTKGQHPVTFLVGETVGAGKRDVEFYVGNSVGVGSHRNDFRRFLQIAIMHAPEHVAGAHVLQRFSTTKKHACERSAFIAVQPAHGGPLVLQKRHCFRRQIPMILLIYSKQTPFNSLHLLSFFIIFHKNSWDLEGHSPHSHRSILVSRSASTSGSTSGKSPACKPRPARRAAAPCSQAAAAAATGGAMP